MDIEILDSGSKVITVVLDERNPDAAVGLYRGASWREYVRPVPVPETLTGKRARLIRQLREDPILFALIKLLAQRFNLTADQVLTALENQID